MAIRDITYSPHHKVLLASVGDDGYVDIWDTVTTKLQVSFTQKTASTFGSNHSQVLYAVKFSPTSPSLLATGGVDRKLSFYDISSNKCVHEISSDYSLTCLDYADDGVTICAGTSNGHILLYDIRQPSKPITKYLSAHPQQQINRIKFQHQPQNKSNPPSGSSSQSSSLPTTSPINASPSASKTMSQPESASKVSSSHTPLPNSTASQISPAPLPSSTLAATSSSNGYQTSSTFAAPSHLSQRPSGSFDSATTTSSLNSMKSSVSSSLSSPNSQFSPQTSTSATFSNPTISSNVSNSTSALKSDDSSFPSSSSSSSSLPSHNGGTVTGSSTNSVQVQLIRRVLEDVLYEFHQNVRNDIQNLHLEMLHQFHTQQEELHSVLQLVTQQTQQLTQEIREIKDEYKQFKTL